MLEVRSSITNCDLYKSWTIYQLQYPTLADASHIYLPIIAVIWPKLTYYSYQITKLEFNNHILYVREYIFNRNILDIKTIKKFYFIIFVYNIFKKTIYLF